jgi:hypothetical protein
LQRLRIAGEQVVHDRGLQQVRIGDARRLGRRQRLLVCIRRNVA